MSLRLLKFTRPYSPALLPMFVGAEGEDDVNDDTNTETGEGEGEDEDDKSDDNDSDNSGTVSREEFEKIVSRMKAADRRASAAEAKVKQYDDKDKNALELATQRIEELEKSLADKDKVLKTQGLENAFHASNSVTWHNPALALKELDLEGVQDDEGNIDRAALKRSIEKLAKAQPYLVKSDADSSGPKKNGKSGANPGGSPQGNNGGANADRQALEKKYPALRR